MNYLAGSCLNAAIALFQDGKIADSVPYFFAAQRFSMNGAIDREIGVLKSLLAERTNGAIAAGDQQSALWFAGFHMVFAPSDRLIVPEREAQARAAAHCEALRRSLDLGQLDSATAHCLAAMALDPERPEAISHRLLLIDGLIARRDAELGRNDPLAATLTLAFLVMLDRSTRHHPVLATLMAQQGDFPLVVALCDQIDAVGAQSDAERLGTRRYRREAQLRIDGAGAEQATRQATLELLDGLDALIADSGWNEVALIMRIDCNGSLMRYRQALADLRELSKRAPNDGWIARQFCVTLRSYLHPDAAASIDVVLQDLGDDPAELRNWFGVAVGMGAVEQALQIAARLAKHRPEYQIVAPLHAMASDLTLQPAATFGRASGVGRTIYCNLVCWGARYLELMESASIASLLAPGNFPSLARSATLVLEIITMPADLAQVQEMALLRKLAEHCEVRVFLFPEGIAASSGRLPYLVFGHGCHSTILRAERDGADLMFLFPDVVYADGCHAALIEHLSNEPVAVFADGLNAQAGPLLEQIAPYRRAEALAPPPQALLDAAATCLTRRSTDFFHQPGNAVSSPTPNRVIFRTETGLRTHAFFMATAYVSHAGFAPVVTKNFGACDGLFVEHVLNAVAEQSVVVLSGDQFLMVEICDDDGLVSPLVEASLDESLLRFFRDYGYSDRRVVLFNRPIDYRTNAVRDGVVTSSEAMAERVQSVGELFRTHSLFVDLRAERDFARALRYPARESQE